MKIIDTVRPVDPITRKLLSVPVGQVFYATLGLGTEMNPRLFLRDYNGAVNLGDPSQTWSNDPILYNYQPVEADVVVRKRL